MKKILFSLQILLFTISGNLISQNYSRFESDVTVKTKYPEGKGTLEMGRIFFNKSSKTLLYNFKFPEKETIYIKDTLVYVIQDGKLVDRVSSIPLVQSTIFNIALEGNLSNYGLKNTYFKPSKVEKDGDLVITTWTLPANVKELGKIMTSTKNKDLYGVVFFDVKGEILSKQLFSNYVMVQGIKFPTEITQIFYKDGTETYQITTFKNIIINNQQNEIFYNYTLPGK